MTLSGLTLLIYSIQGGHIAESFLAKKFLLYWGPITGIILAKNSDFA
jgi:hypothetical protein